jgi:NAD/NADP transhydrogenase beta subunit
MDARSIGLALIAVGLLVVLIGAAVMTGLLGWFGRLPGDIRIEGSNVKVYVPLVSMLLVSVLLSVVLMLLTRLR